MKNIILLLAILTFLLITGCSSTCMEYRSATTAARSEKDLKRAEEWGLKALKSPECNPASNALTPYFLATEIYQKQKNYTEMVKMLNMAEQINPNQLLEEPYKLGEQSVETISEGVNAVREEIWSKLFNKSVTLFNKNKYNKAEKQLKLCLVIHPNRIETYPALVDVYKQNGKDDLVLEIVELGLNIDSKNSYLNMTKADLLTQNNDLETALDLYLKAIEYSDDPGPIMRKLLFIYIELGDNQKAIDYSNELMDKYPNDPDLYYNVGVLYQRLATEIYDSNLKVFNNTDKDSNPKNILNLYKSYKQARNYSYHSRDYFLQASDLEIKQNDSSLEAAKEMKKIMNNIDNLFIPSIKKTAQEVGVELK